MCKATVNLVSEAGVPVTLTISRDDAQEDIIATLQRAERVGEFFLNKGWTVEASAPAAAAVAAAAGPTFCGYPCSPTVNDRGFPTWVIKNGEQAQRREGQGDTWYSIKRITDDGEKTYEGVLSLPKGEQAPSVIWPAQPAQQPAEPTEQPRPAVASTVPGNDHSEASEPPEPNFTPKIKDAPQGSRLPAAMYSRIESLGGTCYGADAWGKFYAQDWAIRVSIGKAKIMRDITTEQADQVLAALEFVQVANRYYGENAADKISAILAGVSKVEGADYTSPVDMPVATAWRMRDKIVALEKESAK